MTQQFTPANEWLPKLEALTLPSGKVIEVRRASVIDMLMSDGNIPESFANLLEKSAEQQDGDGKVTPWKPRPEEFTEITEFYKKVVLATVVRPKVVADREADTDAGEIHLSWISDNDKAAIMSWALGEEVEGLPLKKFPRQPRTGVPASRNGRGVRAKT